MKRFLSLVLTLVMVMSLVTVSAGAKDFTDDESITYDEAVAVVSEVGIVDGYADGKFNPTNTLTRQAAAKIICNLILGPTTASELHADTAPYRDVPVSSEFAGYIAYCQAKGIISGYGDGAFRPGNPLTGYAFMKMLLGALGYDATLENYVGGNWSINVAKQALHIGLNKGLEGEFNGLKPVTREEACLYAFNTLQADLVEYGQRLTTNINGTEVTLSSGGAQSREWKSQQTRINNIREDEIIQFAEEYFKELVKTPDDDVFMRPAHTWVYDKKIQIGTWVDQDKLLETYTNKVTGRDLYDLLGSAIIRDFELEIFVDGHEANNNTTDYRQYGKTQHDGGWEEFTASDLKRSNTDGLGATGKGVLTEIFKDNDNEIIRVVSINTWLSQATSSYSESRETATVKVFKGLNASNVESVSKTVNVEDVPEVADVAADTFYLVRMSDKNTNLLEVVDMEEPEILEESTVTKFSLDTKERSTSVYPDKLTTGGNEYSASKRAYYDADTLDQYAEDLLTTNTYNVYLDKYGYFIGIDLFEGTKQYVFVTGYDMRNSNLSVKTAEAAGIFLDGTMETITVNVKDTNKNIQKMVYGGADNNWTTPKAAGAAGTNAAAYYRQWGTNVSDGVFLLNRWYTYTKTEAGVYTLKPCVDKDGEAMMLAAKSSNTLNGDGEYDDMKLNCAKLRLDGVSNGEALLQGETMTYVNNAVQIRNGKKGVSAPVYNLSAARAYGEDASVFITVDTDDVSGAYVGETGATNKKGRITRGITDVNGVYTGVQDVDLISKMADRVAGDYLLFDGDKAAAPTNNYVSAADVGTNPENNYIADGDGYSYLGENAYAVFDKNNFIVGAIILGEAEGNNGTKAFILDPVKYERYENGKYYWQFEAVINGEIVTQEAEGDFDAIDTMREHQYEIVELRYKDADSELVTDVKEIVRDITTDGGHTRADGDDKIYGYPFDEIVTNGWTGPSGTTWNGGHKVKDDESIYDVVLTGYVGDGAGTVACATHGGHVKFDYVERPGSTYAWGHPNLDCCFNTTELGTLRLQGRTLYVIEGQHDYGIDFTKDAKAVVIQPEGYTNNNNVKDYAPETRDYNTVQEAIDSLGDADPSTVDKKEFRGIITAVLNSQGVAEWIVFHSDTEVDTRNDTAVTGAVMKVDVLYRVNRPDGTVGAGTVYQRVEIGKPATGTTVYIPSPTKLNGGVSPIADYETRLGSLPTNPETLPLTWEKTDEVKQVIFDYWPVGAGTGDISVRVNYVDKDTNKTVGSETITGLTGDTLGYADVKYGDLTIPTSYFVEGSPAATTIMGSGKNGEQVNVTVAALTVASIAVDDDPTQTKYLVGEAFDPTGLTLTVTYNNGDTDTLANTDEMEFSITGGDVDDLVATNTTVTVTYASETDTVTIDVDDPDDVNDVDTIAITQNPTKMTYSQADGNSATTAADLSGSELTITCDNGRTKVVTSGYTGTIDTTTIGTGKTITVTHAANTKTCAITGVEVTA